MVSERFKLYVSKVAAHPRGSDAERLSRNARGNHGSYTEHFNHICTIVTIELRMIEGLFCDARD